MALEGTFDDMPLVDLIDMFRIGIKSGILDIVGDRQRGSIYVSYGRLIDATVQDLPAEPVRLIGDRAVIELLGWGRGQFVFVSDLAVIRRPVTIFLDGAELIERSYHRAAAPARADHSLRHTVELTAIDNHEFSADLGGCQRSRRLPAREQAWRFRPTAPDQLGGPHDHAGARGAQSAQLALLERASGQPYQARAIAQAPAAPAIPAAPVNKAARPAGRLLQAVIRRVRGL